MEAFVGKLGLTLSSMHGLGGEVGGDIPALSCGPAPDFPIACVVGIAPVTGKTIAIPMSVATMIWVHFDGQLSVLEGKLSIS